MGYSRTLHLAAISLVALACVFLGGAAVGRATTFPVTAPSTGAAATAPAARKAVVISVEGRIDDYTRREIKRRVEDARALGVDTVILRLNTPGGLAHAGLDISRFLKQQDDLHVIAYVEEMALSAGIMIGMAADEIVMQPGSMIGDSAPIALAPGGGMQTLGEAERAKAESPILADFRDSAYKNGYDPLLAEAMVSYGRVVHWVENDKGERRFADAAQFAKLSGEGWRDVSEPGVPVPVDSAQTLLTVHADAAVKLGLAKGTAASVADLASQRGLTIAATYEKSNGTRLVEWLGNDVVRAILFLVFIQALVVSLHAPGHGMAEALALASLAVLLGVPMLTGYAQPWEIVAIVLGLVLLALEIFVIPGFGVAGITGLVLLLLGFVMTFVGNAPGLPTWSMPGVWRGVQTGLTAVLFSLIGSFVLTLWLRRYLPKLPFFNRLVLATPAGTVPASSVGTAPPEAWPFVGTIGRAVSDLKPGGTAQFPYADDARVTAVVSDSGYVEAGSKIAVREVRGNRIVVRNVIG